MALGSIRSSLHERFSQTLHALDILLTLKTTCHALCSVFDAETIHGMPTPFRALLPLPSPPTVAMAAPFAFAAVTAVADCFPLRNQETKPVTWPFWMKTLWKLYCQLQCPFQLRHRWYSLIAKHAATKSAPSNQ